MTEPPELDEISRLAQEAFQRAAVQVVRRASFAGTPVVLWEDGRIKLVPPSELLSLLPPSSAATPEGRTDSRTP